MSSTGSTSCTAVFFLHQIRPHPIAREKLDIFLQFPAVFNIIPLKPIPTEVGTRLQYDTQSCHLEVRGLPAVSFMLFAAGCFRQRKSSGSSAFSQFAYQVRVQPIFASPIRGGWRKPLRQNCPEASIRPPKVHWSACDLLSALKSCHSFPVFSSSLNKAMVKVIATHVEGTLDIALLALRYKQQRLKSSVPDGWMDGWIVHIRERGGR